MPVSFTGNYVVGVGGATSWTLPSAPTVGNLLVAIGFNTNTMGGGQVGTGWSPGGGFNATNPYGGIAYKTVTASDTAVQTPFTRALSTVWIVELTAPEGFTASPVDAVNINRAGATSPPSVQGLAVTPTYPGEFLIEAIINNSLVNSPPATVAGLTTLATFAGTGGNNGSGALYYASSLTAGTAYGPYTFTWSAGNVAATAAALIIQPTIRKATVTQTCGCGPTSINAITGLRNQPNSANFTGNVAAINGSSTVTLPSTPAVGNLLLAFGYTASMPLPAAGWTLAIAASAPNGSVAWRIVQAGDTATVTPFGPGSGLALVVAEFQSTAGWADNPIEVATATSSTGAPPVFNSLTIVPKIVQDIAVTFTWTGTAGRANTPPGAGSPAATPAGLMGVIYTPIPSGTSGYGSGTVFYQPFTGGVPVMPQMAWSGSTSAAANAVNIALAALPTIHASLSQTCGCTLSATAVRTTHASVVKTISCTLVATGKASIIHCTLTPQTLTAILHATGTAKVIHASLSQTVSCTLSATGGQPIYAEVSQVVIEGMASPLEPYLMVAQVVLEGMSSYETVPLQIAQVVIESMAPNVYPYNPQPPEAQQPQLQ